MIATELLFFATAAIAGALNAVAGGGSFLLFPILMLGGMSPVTANVMCTIAMWPGSIVSAYAYWRVVNTPVAKLTRLVIVSLIGGGIGAWILLYFPESTFESLVPWLLLVATLVFTFGRRMIALLRFEHASTSMPAVYVAMLCFSIYGGYFGAGVGILMLAMLQLAGYSNMHEMNGLKTVLGMSINAVAVVIFIANGSVLWQHAPMLIAGGVLGGYVGTRLALKVQPERVRKLAVFIAFAMTGYFFLKT